MLNEINICDLLFIDIETVPQCKSFGEMTGKMQALWDKKSNYFREEGESGEDVYSRAGIYAEFGKIICISAGIVSFSKNEYRMRIKSYYGDDEKLLLSDFCTMLEHFAANKRSVFLCAHNGKEFDFPYISRRLLINGLKLPAVFDNSGKKPWEIAHLDTMELWKFGDYKHYTSLDLLATIFDIPSPKNDMDGSMVADVYWKEGDTARIVEYCQNDVQATAQLFMRYKGMDLIKPENIDIVKE